jgi:hypothetical protein
MIRYSYFAVMLSLQYHNRISKARKSFIIFGLWYLLLKSLPRWKCIRGVSVNFGLVNAIQTTMTKICNTSYIIRQGMYNKASLSCCHLLVVKLLVVGCWLLWQLEVGSTASGQAGQLINVSQYWLLISTPTLTVKHTKIYTHTCIHANMWDFYSLNHF